MSVRIQSAMAEAMVQRRMAAGFTVTSRLSGSTTASSRTRSSPPQPPAPWISGILGAIAISSVSAEPAGRERAGSRARLVHLASRPRAGICFSAEGSRGAAAGASAGRALGNGTDAVKGNAAHALAGSLDGAIGAATRAGPRPFARPPPGDLRSQRQHQRN